jgi:hypothetical protein
MNLPDDFWAPNQLRTQYTCHLSRPRETLPPHLGSRNQGAGCVATKAGADPTTGSRHPPGRCRRCAHSRLLLSRGGKKRNILERLTTMSRAKSSSSRSSSSTAKRGHTPLLEPMAPKERRISTPRPDLLVVKIGRPRSKEPVSSREKASVLVAGLVRATRKPGTSRKRIFDSSVGKRVFAYSVYPGDTTKIVREDASGKRSIGRFVNGRFRSLPPKTP